ncbi:unnamed protein product [Litomosoides sigmodontis]|uniref:RNase NYN domain-containing protein n=1 Tax=Litomosoides sigmodontis TaxID=42156 RepID=A0A3P6SJV8_LITSI|nr:unnamed protein product [Litomosoides sigmodontis]
MYPFDRIRERTYVRPSESAVARLIVIDGCNVARSSCGIDPIIRFLLIRDLDVVVFLPVIYNNNYNFNATNSQVLSKLQVLDVLTFTPARTAHAGRRAFINYDDLYVLEFAERHGGCVLSGDRYNDIAKEHSYKDLRRIIKKRRINVIFRPLASDFVYYGRDRFFRFLPELCIIQDTNDCYPTEHIQQRLFCLPNDKDYDKVVSRRRRWTVERRDEIISTIDALFDEIAMKNCLVPKIIPVQTSNTKELSNGTVSVECESDYKDLNFIHPAELTKRWLSPPAPRFATPKRQRKAKQPGPKMAPRYAVLPITSTKLTTSQSISTAYDARCAKIISCLEQIFDRAIIIKVLTENKIRDLHVIANLCAQQTTN